MYGVGTNGQGANIEANPDMDAYMVGSSLSLVCEPDSSASTNTNLMYMWSCSGCFADGNTTPTVTTPHLTDMDSSIINCTIINGTEVYRSDPFNLQVTTGTC